MTKTYIEEYARTIDPGAWSLHGTRARRGVARAVARENFNYNEYIAGVGARARNIAGQWEHIARVVCFDFLGISQLAFNAIVERERKRYIMGGTKS